MGNRSLDRNRHKRSKDSGGRPAVPAAAGKVGTLPTPNPPTALAAEALPTITYFSLAFAWNLPEQTLCPFPTLHCQPCEIEKSHDPSPKAMKGMSSSEQWQLGATLLEHSGAPCCGETGGTHVHSGALCTHQSNCCYAALGQGKYGVFHAPTWPVQNLTRQTLAM